MKTKILLLLSVVLCTSLLHAQDYEKANQLFENGNYAEAAAEYEKVIPWLEKNYGKTDTTSIPLYTYLLGASYYYGRQDDKALKTLERVVTFCAKHCDYVNTYAMRAHDMKASIYAEQNQHEKVIAERKAIVQLHEKKDYKKPGLANTAFAYNDLGIAYYIAAKDQEAVTAYNQALALLKKTGSDYTADIATIKVNLAKSELYLNAINDAAAHYKEAFSDAYQLFPTNYQEKISTFQVEGQSLINAGDYGLAQEALKIDISCKKEVINPTDTSLIESYIFLGQAYHYGNQPEPAKTAFDQVIPIVEKQFKGKESDLSFWYNYMAGMYELVNQKPLAFEYYERSIPYYESILSTAPYGFIITTTSMVRLANEIGEHEKAIKYAKSKLDYFDKNFNKNDQNSYQGYMNSIYDLAILYTNTLQMEQAENTILQAYEKDKNLEVNPDLHVNLQDQLFQIYSGSGQHEKGHNLIDKELDYIAKNYGKDDLYYITMVGKGLLYSQQGENLKAIELFDEIYPHFEGRKDHNEANVLNNLGLCYIELGNFKKAEKKYADALSIHQSIDTNTQYFIAALGNLGKLYFDQSDFEKSKSYYKRAKVIAENVLGKVSKEYVTITNSMGNTLFYSGEYEEAFEHYQESLKYMEQVYDKNHPNVLSLLGNIGHSLCMMRMFEDGIDIIEKVHDRSAKSAGESSFNTLLFKTNLAMAYHSSDRPEDAKKQMLELLTGIDQNINYNLKYMNESASLAFLNKMDIYYSSIYSYLFDQREDAEVVGSCFNSTLKNKGKLLESNTALKNQVAKSKNPKLIETYEEWITKVKTLVSLQSGENIDLKLLDKTQHEAEKLEEALMKLSSDFAKQMSKNFDWKEVQKNLQPNEIIVEFLRIDHQTDFIKDSIYYGAFLLDKNMTNPVFIPVCTETSLTQLMGEVSANNLNFVQEVYGKGGEKSKLHQLLIKPLQPYLDGMKTVYISPDGVLHKVAFSAISDGTGYFDQRFNVLMINSGSVLLDEANNTIEKPSPLLIGGVEYNKEGVTDEVWKYLAGTKTEVSGILELLSQQKASSKLLTGEEATETNFNAFIADANMIHIATHGFFYPEPSLAQQVVLQETESIEDISFRGGTRGAGYNYYVTNNDPMMRSGIALSGANQVWNNPDIPMSEDGVLTALDFSLMDLQNIELIVLSACETGLGDVKGSEGVYGLQRSLKLAGANHIIMSLWQVPDKETKEFMLYFYKELLTTKNIEQSFISTQRAMSSKYDPYYWGAFILL